MFIVVIQFLKSMDHISEAELNICYCIAHLALKQTSFDLSSPLVLVDTVSFAFVLKSLEMWILM